MSERVISSALLFFLSQNCFGIWVLLWFEINFSIICPSFVKKKKCSEYFDRNYIKSVGEGNGTPLQYSCLENPMDGGAWWAAVHGSQRVRHD